MRIERTVDTERGTVRFAFELPLGMHPDTAGDLAFDHVTRLMTEMAHHAAALVATTTGEP